ncbi:MAG: hypothetical protein IJO39_01495 [Clostridia bacterium]|nr:hypothetical protein [Clostridia bacterium]
MRARRWISTFIIFLLCVSSTALAGNETQPEWLVEQYGEPVLMSENAEIYEAGITICFFPGEGIVILYKLSDDAEQLNAWEIARSDALEGYVANALCNEPAKTVYIDFSDMSAKQYPDDFTAASVPDAEKYCDYETFLNVLIGIDADDSRETATKDATSWGTWSGWSTTKVSSDSNTQVEKKTQYRSRSIYKNQDYSSWSGWSDWSTTAASESSTRDVETKTEYRYRDTTNQTQYSDWGTWSGWSTTATSETALRDVETKTEETVTVTYTYKHWRYYNNNEGKWMSTYTEYKRGGYKEGSGKWEYVTVSKPLKASGSRDGNTYYRHNGQNWYHQTKKETTESTTYYRYRTRSEQQVPVIGSWSGWSSTAATATSTREVQTRTLYRYRTRDVVTKNTYGKWSEWTDSWIGENSDRDVETRTVYRYRKSK